jgi:tryptophan synthase beta chain
MGYKNVVTDTGSGDQGVATASVAAKLGLTCTIYMAEPHRRSQDAMVRRMIAFGADIRTVPGDGTMLHHAMSAAIQHWMGAADSCMYVAGGPVGPHPYPAMVHLFQGVIGNEVADQCNAAIGSLPSIAVAALGGGSSAIGLFARFLDEPVKLVVAEAGGSGSDFGRHSASLTCGQPGILHGAQTLVLQDNDGQVTKGSSIASGLTYPGVGPELAHLYTSGRVEADVVTNDEAIKALRYLAEDEGIIVSLEAAHAVAAACSLSQALPKTYSIVCVINSAGSQDNQHLAALEADS